MRGSTRDHAISYEQMLTFHGQAHAGGVAVAYRVVEAALSRLAPGEVPERDRIRIVSGVDGPGIIDGLEFLTRAFTRNRGFVDRRVTKGALVLGERFSFEVHYKGKAVSVAVKDGVFTPDFLALAAKHAGKTASDAEKAQFVTARAALAAKVMAANVTDLFDIADLAA
jgi:hypothetical protein